MAAANGKELLAAGGNAEPAVLLQQSEQSVHEDLERRAPTIRLVDRDSLSLAYTVDNGNSVIRKRPLFASGEALQSQIASVREVHVFSPRGSYATIGFSRAEFNLNALSLRRFLQINPSSLEEGREAS